MEPSPLSVIHLAPRPKKRKFNLTEAEKAEIVSLYKNHIQLKVISARFGVGRAYINALARAAGIPRRCKWKGYDRPRHRKPWYVFQTSVTEVITTGFLLKDIPTYFYVKDHDLRVGDVVKITVERLSTTKVTVQCLSSPHTPQPPSSNSSSSETPNQEKPGRLYP